MKKLAIIAGLAALIFGACSQNGNGNDAVQTDSISEAAPQPTPYDSLFAKCDRLNAEFRAEKSKDGIDSIKFFNGVLTFYCNTPKGFLASKQNTDQLPATAIGKLEILGAEAIGEIVHTGTKVKFHYREDGEDGAIHNVSLSSQAVKKLYKSMTETDKK